MTRSPLRRLAPASVILLPAIAASCLGPGLSEEAEVRQIMKGHDPFMHERKFADFAGPFLDGWYDRSPTAATGDGIHRLDGKLDDFSVTGLQETSIWCRYMFHQMILINPAALTTDSMLDYLLAGNRLQLRLLRLEKVRDWERDPGIYVSTAAAGIQQLLQREFAPAPERFRSIVSRLGALPALLDAGRKNLKNPPAVYVELAEEESAGLRTLIAATLPDAFAAAVAAEEADPEVAGVREEAEALRKREADLAEVQGVLDADSGGVERARTEIRAAWDALDRRGPGLARRRRLQTLREDWETIHPKAVAAVDAWRTWLRDELKPAANGAFAMGEADFILHLRYSDCVRTPPRELLAQGEAELHRLQARFRATAAKIDAGRPAEEVLRGLASDHPAADALVPETEALLEGLRRFGEEKNLLTYASADRCVVRETPAFRRATTFASMDTPGPFDAGSLPAFYSVTPPEPDWTPEKTEEHLRFFGRWALPVIAIHEAYPGHFAQLDRARRVPSRIRRAFGSTSGVEGWAHYCEEMALDEGYGGGDPRLRLAQLHLALLRACRWVAAVKLHTQGWTIDEAAAFFRTEGFQEEANARREARRAARDPEVFGYAWGKLELLRLREDCRRLWGSAFTLKAFHDAVLAEGGVPPKLLRMDLLGEGW